MSMVFDGSRGLPRKTFERYSVPTVIVGDSMTKQEFSAECDINNVMKRYQKSGVIEHRSSYEGRYGDFLDAPDYQTAANAIIAADEMFASLPSTVRREFDNDPVRFLEFVHDPKNEDRIYEMGLAVRKPAPGATLEDVISAVKAGPQGEGSA